MGRNSSRNSEPVIGSYPDPEGNCDAPVEDRIVEETFVRVATLWCVQVRGRSIRTTAEHLFFVQSKGWRCAMELQPGDMLSSHDGQQVSVEAVKQLNEVAMVYNLRVSEFHTYFVGSSEWRFSVWAHNAACGESVRLALEAEGISIPKGDPRLDTIAKHINDGELGAARKAIQDLPGGGQKTGKTLTNILDAAENPPVKGNPAPTTPGQRVGMASKETAAPPNRPAPFSRRREMRPRRLEPRPAPGQALSPPAQQNTNPFGLRHIG